MTWTLAIALAGFGLGLWNAWRQWTQPGRQRQAEHRTAMRATLVELRADVSAALTEAKRDRVPRETPAVASQVEAWDDYRNAPPVDDDAIRSKARVLSSALTLLDAHVDGARYHAQEQDRAKERADHMRYADLGRALQNDTQAISKSCSSVLRHLDEMLDRLDALDKRG